MNELLTEEGANGIGAKIGRGLIRGGAGSRDGDETEDETGIFNLENQERMIFIYLKVNCCPCGMARMLNSRKSTEKPF